MNQSGINETKNNNNNSITDQKIASNNAMTPIIEHLQLLMSKTMAKRLICAILLIARLPKYSIAALLGICDRTIRRINKQITSGNLGAALVAKKHGRKGKLTDCAQAILKEIYSDNYFTRLQILEMIKEKFGIDTSITAVGRFLKKHGIKCLKSGSLPAKANPQQQREFYDNTLQRLMELGTLGSEVVLFVDAAHFVFCLGFLGHIYCKVRRYMPTPSGRFRYNVLGALNFATKKMTTVTNTTYITATQVCELLRKIAIEYAGKKISIVLDNASYQRCKAVQEVAAELGIKLVFLPPYSPNLNLIERYWKFVKGKLRTKTYTTFTLFCEAITLIMACEDSKDKKALDSLISAKFQLFDGMVPINWSNNTFQMGDRKVA
jgi:transposase